MICLAQAEGVLVGYLPGCCGAIEGQCRTMPSVQTRS